MPLYRPPEITTSPLEDLILQMKSIGISSVESFPFPTPPPPAVVNSAITLLTNLGVVEPAAQRSSSNSKSILSTIDKALGKDPGINNRGDQSGLSELGCLVSKFPINPRYAKMIVMAHRFDDMSSSQSDTPKRYPLLSYTLSLVACLAERSVFDGEGMKSQALNKKEEDEDADGSGDEEEEESRDVANATQLDMLFYHNEGDAMARLKATGAFLFLFVQSWTNTKKAKAATIAKEVKVKNVKR